MSTARRFGAFICGTLILSASAYAHSPKELAVTKMQELQRLVGTWQCECKTTKAMGGEVTTLHATLTVEPVLGGAWHQLRFTAEPQGGIEEKLEGLVLTTFDASVGKYISYSANSFGSHGKAFSSGLHDNRLVFNGVLNNVADEQMVPIRKNVEFIGDNELAVAMEVERDGQVQLVHEARCTK